MKAVHFYLKYKQIRRINMKRILSLSLIIVGILAASLHAQDTTKTDLTEIGQLVPEFSTTTIDGEAFHSRKLEGKVTLINFFATWCGPCNAEMPHLEKDIYQKFKEESFAVISIGREHTKEELDAFRKKKELSFPMAPDPERDIYKKFATMYIPRNYLIDKSGRIAYQNKGFDEKELDRLTNKIQALLKE